MSKKETFSVKKIFFQNITWIAAVLVAFINIWLSFKLSPLEQNIRTNSFRIQAVETWADRHEDYSVRMEGKIDQLIKDVSAINERCK